MNNYFYQRVTKCTECSCHDLSPRWLFCEYGATSLFKKGESRLINNEGDEGQRTGEGFSYIPDWCPAISGRIDQLYSKLLEDKSFKKVAKKCNRPYDPDDFMTNFNHDLRHAVHVLHYGLDFLNQLPVDQYGYVRYPADLSKKDIRYLKRDRNLFKIAAILHDIGLSKTDDNHAAVGAEMAKRYLDPHYISPSDAEIITHAIAQHSDGKELNNIVDAALYLADKLDVDRYRLINQKRKKLKHPVEKLMRQIKKITYTIPTVSCGMGLGAYDAVGDTAILRYVVKGDYDATVFYDWGSSIIAPLRVAKEFLGLRHFKFLVNDTEMDYQNIIAKTKH